VNLGPTSYLGEITIFGNDPFLFLQMSLGGSRQFDLLNTAGISLILPPGTTYESGSGVFLSQSVSVPEPATLLLIAPAIFFLVLLARILRRRNGF
jgi:hypothetical protein